jgi:hypothetical protein
MFSAPGVPASPVGTSVAFENKRFSVFVAAIISCLVNGLVLTVLKAS